MIKHLIHKEFLQIRRNAFLPRLIVLFPIVIMCVMPWVMQMEVNPVHIVEDNKDLICHINLPLMHVIQHPLVFLSGVPSSMFSQTSSSPEWPKRPTLITIFPFQCQTLLCF